MRTAPLARALPAAALLLVLAVAACSPAATQAPSAAPTAASAAPAVGGGSVTIANFSFAPASLSVAAGTTVTWTNTDSASHTVTADDGSFGSQRLANGATFSQTFTKPGTYAYHCSIHPSMTATVVVH